MTGTGREAAEANARAWEAVLEQLERDVEATEELARHADGAVVPAQPVAWRPPPLHGPLPDHLLQRARQLHRRQSAARALLTRALAVNRADVVRVAQRAPAGTDPASAYLDVSV